MGGGGVWPLVENTEYSAKNCPPLPASLLVTTLSSFLISPVWWKQSAIKVRNISFLSPLVLSKWENLALLSLYIFGWKCVYFSIFGWWNSLLCQTKHNYEFLNDKNNCVKQNIIVHFISQKWKDKHTFLKKSTNWGKLSSLILTEREETKTRYFEPKITSKTRRDFVAVEESRHESQMGPSYPLHWYFFDWRKSGFCFSTEWTKQVMWCLALLCFWIFEIVNLRE